MQPKKSLITYLTAVLLGCGSCLSAQSPALTLSSGSGVPGGMVIVNLSLIAGSTAPAGLQWTLNYSTANIVAVTMTVGDATTAAGKSLSCAGSPGSYTCLATGLNTNTIAAGVVASATVTLAPTAVSTTINVTGTLGADPNGNPIPVAGFAGVVTVAQPVTVAGLTCAPSSLAGGASSICAVALSTPAPANGAVISLSSNNSLLTVPTSITVNAGLSSNSFAATASNLIPAPQAATVTASYNASAKSFSLSLTATITVASLQCNPTTLGVNATSSCIVTLSAPAPPGGVVVTLSTALPGLTVPRAVNVVGGAATASFALTAYSVAVTQTGPLIATYQGSSRSVTLTLTASAVVASLQCNSTTLTSNSRTSCTVTLSAPTSGNGAVVALGTALRNLSVPRAVIVPAGILNGTFTITTFSIASPQTGILVATYNSSYQSVSLTLAPSLSAPTFSFQCVPSILTTGDSALCTVALPDGAVGSAPQVRLASDKEVLQLPANVKFREGDRTVTFRVRSRISDRSEDATIRASIQDVVQAARISLRGIKPAALICTPKAIGAGEYATCEIRLDSPPGANGIPLELTGSGNALRLPTKVMARRGQSSLTFRAFAAGPSDHDPAVIEARIGDSAVEDTISVVPQAGPVLSVPSRLLARLGDRVSFTVSASDGGDLPIALSVANLPGGASFDALTGQFAWIPSASQTGTYKIVFTATNSAHVSTTEFLDLEVGSGQPEISALVNGASQSPDAPCSPRAVVSVLGRWLSNGERAAEVSGSALQLAGTRVRVNGEAARVLYVDPTRVDFLSPEDPAGTPLEIRVETGAGTSAPVRTIMASAGPGVFSLDGSGQGAGAVFDARSAAATVRDYRSNGAPAQPGDLLSIRATGLGPFDGHSGQKPLVRIADSYAEVQSVSPSPEFAGVYEIKVIVPVGATGDEVPLWLELPEPESVSSNTVSVAIEAARQ